MANRPKGDAQIKINGESKTIRLTLGAIAEIEDDLGVGLAQMGEIMKNGQMKPIVTIVYWMLRAGGWNELRKEDLLTAEVNLTEVMKEFPTAFSKFTGKDVEAVEEEPEGN